jgi:hypothetical protein
MPACGICQGQGVTDRVHYEVTIDEHGQQSHEERHTIEQCSHCRGSGTDD